MSLLKKSFKIIRFEKPKIKNNLRMKVRLKLLKSGQYTKSYGNIAFYDYHKSNKMLKLCLRNKLLFYIYNKGFFFKKKFFKYFIKSSFFYKEFKN